MDRKKRTRPLALILLILLGIGIAGAWRERQWIAWRIADASPAALALGPVGARVPADLPARIRFSPAGDVVLTAGDPSFDAVAVELSVMPTEERLEGAAADDVLARLRLSLLADDPTARAEIAPHEGNGGLPALQVRSKDGGHTVVVLAGQSLVRLEVRLSPRAPDKWRAAADILPRSLRVEEALVTGGVWRSFGPLALEACERRDLAACAYASRAALERGKPAEAAEIAGDALDENPPLEGDGWSATHLALVRVLGEGQLAAGHPEKALAAWGRAWSRDESGALAGRLLDVAARLVAAERPEAELWVERANEAAERFHEHPDVVLAAARVAAAAGRYYDAKALAQRAYDETDDDALRRRAVSVRAAPAPKLAPLACPRGTVAKRFEDGVGTREEACVDGSGRRRGPSRRSYAESGLLLSETTWKDGSEGPPDRRYWENGVLQRRSLVDARGAVTVERFDPFGRPIAEPDEDEDERGE